ncbi:MAG TPA: MerR family transcriptional regulator [Longimicrobium sp.]|nr:MerR family transcriptional regulator [Longimicrobium sp.]
MSSDVNDQEPRHPIRVVSERTGLSPDVLRAWEKRYGAVAPPRREGAGQRLYSDADVARLRLLRRVTGAGRSIGQVAALGDDDLARLAREDEAQRAAAPAHAVTAGEGNAAAAYLQRALAAVSELDGGTLETVLRRALVVLGADAFIDDVAVPFLRRVGDAWEARTLSVAHEHLSSAVMRRVLAIVSDAGAASAAAHTIVVATPAGQVHELGAMLAAASATAAGWRVVYLGADLPAADIAATAAETGASAVAVSALLPNDAAALAGELRALRRELPPAVELIAGGEGARATAGVLVEAGVRFLPDFAEFRRTLVRLASWANGRGAEG